MLTIREFLLRLALCPGLGPVSKYQIWVLARYKWAFNDINLLVEDERLNKQARRALEEHWHSRELTRQVQLNLEQSFITIVDSDYPPQLKEIYCPPLVIFYAGQRTLLSGQMLGVVGARQMTSYGAGVLRGILPTMVAHNLTIVSGLAAGVDGLSHQLALEHHGKTVAVVGCGLDLVYPRQHKKLQAQVMQHGLVLSEYGLGAAPLAFHFPERNRIIAGLAETILVVEARQRSGSLITANLALNENRNVCAIPGRIDAPYSMGCNDLIRAGATPVHNADDLLAEFRSLN